MLLVNSKFVNKTISIYFIILKPFVTSMANHVLGTIDTLVIKPDQNAYYFRTDVVMQLSD